MGVTEWDAWERMVRSSRIECFKQRTNLRFHLHIVLDRLRDFLGDQIAAAPPQPMRRDAHGALGHLQ